MEYSLLHGSCGVDDLIPIGWEVSPIYGVLPAGSCGVDDLIPIGWEVSPMESSLLGAVVLQ